MKKLFVFLPACLVACASVPPHRVYEQSHHNEMSVVALRDEPSRIEDEIVVIEEHRECPEDMILVDGNYCPSVTQECLSWLPGEHPVIGKLRCATFKSPTICNSKERDHKHFCMDKYEYPNIAGVLPPVDVTWYAMKSNCEKNGKRLCTASEWTLACEGEDMHPYPYGDGYHRDEAVCDQTHSPMPDPSSPRSVWPKYYPGHPSGSFTGCKSSFGVYDMVAGVDEWVVNESGKPHISGLKGGYGTALVRTRCRPMTDIHGPTDSFYQIGGRCCK